MSGDLNTTMSAATAAITGSGTPEAITATQREDAMSIWFRNLAGPAISIMVVGVIWVLTWGLRWSLWTGKTEALRAQLVGWMGIVLCILLGVLVWRIAGGRPGRIEVKAGPAEVVIDSNGGA